MRSRLWLFLLLPSILPGLVFYDTSAKAELFHSGGIGYCGGCHTTHNSSGGRRMTLDPLPSSEANEYLLIGRDPSSTCLNCHELAGDTGPDNHHVSTAKVNMPDGSPPLQLTPGGDFGWLKKSYSWVDESGATQTSPGERHGHNIVAADFGYGADTVHAKSPGGSYPSGSLQCTSCHDPHGQYRILADGTEATTTEPIKGSGSYGDMPTNAEAVGVYRLLGGAGYEGKPPSGTVFTSPSPAAVSPVSYNRSEAATMTRVAYGSGMSEWCANCHGQLLRSSYIPGAPDQAHPSGKYVKLGPVVAGYYNAYVRSGDLSGSLAKSYISLVPFETGDKNDFSGRQTMAALAQCTDSRLDGPSPECNVCCLTCHRAHASGWDSMLRWNPKSDYIVYKGVYPGMDNGASVSYAQGRTSAETARAYYNIAPARFSSDQRSLCNKCHPKD